LKPVLADPLPLASDFYRSGPTCVREARDRVEGAAPIAQTHAIQTKSLTLLRALNATGDLYAAHLRNEKEHW